MFLAAPQSTGARPYKIFISLLDKWEIGSALSEVLILDAFNAIHRASVKPTGNGDDSIQADVR